MHTVEDILRTHRYDRYNKRCIECPGGWGMTLQQWETHIAKLVAPERSSCEEVHR